jgi:hypothetical protein
LIGLLKRVTLIEPSEASLERAKENVLYATGDSVTINTIAEYLPADDSTDNFHGINYVCGNVIHVFSNILDVSGIDLRRVAQAVATSSHNTYVLCMGPLNANANRIDRFYQIFGKQELFSNISNSRYAYTSRTNHPITCKTKCFVYNGGSLILSAYNPTADSGKEIFDEYDVRLLVQNGLSLNKARVYFRLQQILNQDDLIYIEPDLSEAKPDFVILRPNIGVLIVNVFEENLSKIREPRVGSGGSADEESLQNPILTLTAYQDNFINSVAELTSAVIESVRNKGLVKKLLICSEATTAEARAYFGEDTHHTTIYGNDFVIDRNSYLNLFSNMNFTCRNEIFDTSALQRLIKLLSPTWHSYREGKNITLTTPQRNLSKSQANVMQKISGVAGAGKTQVMCTRAINAVKRTGGKVLILSFNITLVNYLRIRLSEIREDFSWSNIELDNYHNFFRKMAGVCNLSMKKEYSLRDCENYDDVRFFDKSQRKIQKYDSIFIDEVQDFKNEWLQLLKKVFLKEGGEFVVFGDPSQNIYCRERDKQGDIRIGIIPGQWNKSLSKSERFANPSLLKLAIKFKRQFHIGSITEQEQEQESALCGQLSYNVIEYHSIESWGDLQYTAQLILNIIYPILDELHQRNTPEIKDVAIISPNINILQAIDGLYRLENNAQTTLTFLTNEQKAKISKNKNNSIVTYAYKQNKSRIEKQLKQSFTTDTPYLKLATIHSFKGWEAQTIVLIIQSEWREQGEQFNVPELVYTGITRSRENLIVINVGNRYYHDFFETNIHSKTDDIQ